MLRFIAHDVRTEEEGGMCSIFVMYLACTTTSIYHHVVVATMGLEILFKVRKEWELISQ